MKKKLQPVFIMGAPRSGTTLLAGMLSNRSDALCLPEMHYIHELLKQEVIYGNISKQEVFCALKYHFMFKDINIVSDDKELENIISDTVKATIDNIINLYNQKYVNKIFNIWIEHTPHNHLYFEALLLQYPNAKFIHVVRDGRAVYNSTKQTDWGYKDVITGAQDWQNNVTDCLLKEKLYGNKVLTVKYEDLTRSSKDIVSEICDFIEIDFQESMLVSKGIKKPSFAKYTKDLGKKANTKSHNVWMSTLNSAEIEHFTAVNYNLLNHFNYDVSGFNVHEIKGSKRYLIKFFGLIKTLYFRRVAKKRFNSVFK